jgi:hypothetical protein
MASVTGARNTCPACSMASSTANPIPTMASRAALFSIRSNWLWLESNWAVPKWR